MASRTQLPLVRRAISVRRQERSERRQQLLWRLLGDPMSAVGNELALHVLSNQPHGLRDALAEGFASADREHGQRHFALLALFVLRDGDIDRSIRSETAAERVAARREALDVVPDDGLRQRRAR